MTKGMFFYHSKRKSIRGRRKRPYKKKTKKRTKRQVSTRTIQSIDKNELIRLAKKYSVNYKSQSKTQIAKNLCDLRSTYMTKKEKLYIMPIVPNNRNKEIMKQYINDKPKKLPR